MASFSDWSSTTDRRNKKGDDGEVKKKKKKKKKTSWSKSSHLDMFTRYQKASSHQEQRNVRQSGPSRRKQSGPAAHRSSPVPAGTVTCCDDKEDDKGTETETGKKTPPSAPKLALALCPLTSRAAPRPKPGRHVSRSAAP